MARTIVAPSPNILDYARPRRTDRRRLTLARWYAFERPLDDAEFVILDWIAAVALWILVAVNGDGWSQGNAAGVAMAWSLLPIAAGHAVLRLACRRRRGALAACAIIVAISAPLAGMVQLARCPHATYVQVLGITITIDGNPCHIPQGIEPWWRK